MLLNNDSGSLEANNDDSLEATINDELINIEGVIIHSLRTANTADEGEDEDYEDAGHCSQSCADTFGGMLISSLATGSLDLILNGDAFTSDFAFNGENTVNSLLRTAAVVGGSVAAGTLPHLWGNRSSFFSNTRLMANIAASASVIAITKLIQALSNPNRDEDPASTPTLLATLTVSSLFALICVCRNIEACLDRSDANDRRYVP